VFAASSANASLTLPVYCPSDGCGLVVALVQSYQPLGLLDLFVDATLVSARVSAAQPTWAKHRSPKITVQSLHTAVAHRKRGAAHGGLARGWHELRVVARGETLAEVLDLNLPTNYERHEVHVRGFIIIPTEDNPHARWAR
jgi:hypothetical protein